MEDRNKFKLIYRQLLLTLSYSLASLAACANCFPDTLNVNVLANGGGWKYTQGLNFSQRVTYDLIIDLQLKARNPEQRGEIVVYDLYDTTGSLNFSGVATDTFQQIIEILDFNRGFNYISDISGEMHYSLSEQKVVYLQQDLPNSLGNPPRPYSIVFPSEEYQVIQANIEMPFPWTYSGDGYEVSGKIIVNWPIPPVEVALERLVDEESPDNMRDYTSDSSDEPFVLVREDVTQENFFIAIHPNHFSEKVLFHLTGSTNISGNFANGPARGIKINFSPDTPTQLHIGYDINENGVLDCIEIEQSVPIHALKYTLYNPLTNASVDTIRTVPLEALQWDLENPMIYAPDNIFETRIEGPTDGLNIRVVYTGGGGEQYEEVSGSAQPEGNRCSPLVAKEDGTLGSKYCGCLYNSLESSRIDDNSWQTIQDEIQVNVCHNDVLEIAIFVGTIAVFGKTILDKITTRQIKTLHHLHRTISEKEQRDRLEEKDLFALYWRLIWGARIRGNFLAADFFEWWAKGSKRSGFESVCLENNSLQICNCPSTGFYSNDYKTLKWNEINNLKLLIDVSECPGSADLYNIPFFFKQDQVLEKIKLQIQNSSESTLTGTYQTEDVLVDECISDRDLNRAIGRFRLRAVGKDIGNESATWEKVGGVLNGKQTVKVNVKWQVEDCYDWTETDRKFTIRFDESLGGALEIFHRWQIHYESFSNNSFGGGKAHRFPMGTKDNWPDEEIFVEIDVSTTSSNFLLENDISVFPNPADDELLIELPQSIIKPIIISLFDVLGSLVLQEKGFMKNGFVRFNISQVPPGVYTLLIQTPKYTKTTKVIIR